jgi:hypothetical protein
MERIRIRQLKNPLTQGAGLDMARALELAAAGIWKIRFGFWMLMLSKMAKRWTGSLLWKDCSTSMAFFPLFSPKNFAFLMIVENSFRRNFTAFTVGYGRKNLTVVVNHATV